MLIASSKKNLMQTSIALSLLQACDWPKQQKFKAVFALLILIAIILELCHSLSHEASKTTPIVEAVVRQQNDALYAKVNP